MTPSGIDIKPLPDDVRRPQPEFDRLDPPQDQFRIRLWNGKGSYSPVYRAAELAEGLPFVNLHMTEAKEFAIMVEQLYGGS